MTRPPPFMVDPRPDESIESMLHRLSKATGKPIGALVRSRDEQRVAHALGLSVEQVRHHTAKHRLREHGFHVPKELVRDETRLLCPRCESGSLWAGVVLVTTCAECGVLMQRGDGLEIVPSREALEMQQAFLAHVKEFDSETHKRIGRLREILKVWRARGWGPPSPPGRVTPWTSPGRMADFAARAWPASRRPGTTTSLLGTMMFEELGEPARIPASTVQQERELLHGDLRATGLLPSAIPKYLRSDRRLMETNAHARDLGLAIAHALRLEAAAAARCRNSRVPHPPYSRTMVPILVDHLRGTVPGLLRLSHEARCLSALGTWDQDEAAAVLATLRSIPARLQRQLSLPRDRALGRLGAVWIRTELTHTFPRRGNRFDAKAEEMRAFDRRLNAEDRLLLIEFGLEHLRAVDTDVELAHGTPAPVHRTGRLSNAG